MLLSLITAPTEEPIDVATAKLHSRIDGADDDVLVAAHIQAARLYIEAYTRRQLCTATWELWLPWFPGRRAVVLPLPPLQSVTHVKYYDSDGVLQTFDAANYTLVTPWNATAPEPYCNRGQIALVDTASWPTDLFSRPDAVQVRFVAGYGSAAKVPELLKQAIKVHAGELYERREPIVVGVSTAPATYTVERLAYPFRVFWQGI